MPTMCGTTQTPQDIDLPALRDRYRRERDKRLRPNGDRQYVEAVDDLARFHESDPYSPSVVRDAISEDVDVAVLGGGFGGLITGVNLLKVGVESFRIIEMGGDFGGTWYWNRYPGVQCDGESYIYFPLLAEVNYIPKEKYSYGPEIYEHCQRIGKHFGLYEHALFGTIVRALRWNDALKRWLISTDRGDDIRARFVVMAGGVINKPRLPGVEGINNFRGHSFHTARWDYEYTGGDTTGGLTKLLDKRVAIIGTGATAIQCVPFVGEYAKHLYVFQRTPSYVDERGNRPTDPEWAKTLTPGWQPIRQANFHSAVFEGFSTPEDDMICDGWGEIARNMAAKLNSLGNPKLTTEQLMELRELEDYKAMERIRRRVDGIVKDTRTAEALKPWYRFLCKRPCFNDNYLQTFNRPNVTLVDVSDAKGIERITENGIFANGVEHVVDCIIYASGFEITTDLRRRFGIGVFEGRDALSLYDHWREGYRTLHGIMTHGFPNQFFTGYTQAAVAAAINLMYDQQCGHIAYIIKETLARGAGTVEPSEKAQDDWVRTIRNGALAAHSSTECTPGYYNNEGVKASHSPLFGESYGPGYAAFDQLLKDWRDKGDLEGLVLGN